ncbi:thiamine pyrophosphate-binding protein [Paenibacillus filicis]|uniref:Thiamine pyrophosphate-binding protein n=1 Tax=Paenibacillus gyeongsangnamensis TaxID=3388067 RepID=A0ABT4Q507_9BACL|nr:thiamine pyrophosphate-binding protein [Paenibacillus filicis]MCZ8511950.1 thiamine pyrophosphate-binding protein [Paenibacillus filicis]
MMRCSQVLAANFKRWGIEHVFGIPGKSISPLMLDVDSEGIEFVLTRHESGAGFAAAGYSLMKRTLGVAIGTSGPGGTNLLTAAGQAKAYHLPLLILTGQPSAEDSGKAMGQDSSSFGTDLVKMFEPVTLFSARVERPDLLERYLQHAVEKACTGIRGPVHLCVPFDILTASIEPFTLSLPTHVPRVISPNLEEAVQVISEARRPVIVAGKGVAISEAYGELKELAERCQIPVILTPGGKGVIPTLHPLNLGNFGLGGTKAAYQYLKSGVDVMIVIGTKLSDMSLSGFTPDMMPERVVHFDYEATFVGKALPVPTCLVLGDAKQNLFRLLQLLPEYSHSGFEAAAAAEVLEEETPTQHGELSAVDAVKALRTALPADAVLFGDDGSHTFYAIQHFEIMEPGTFHFDDVFGAMGHAIGYAVGAKAGDPERTIVCLTGDGCVMMHGTEISTAVNHGLPVIFVVLNNGRLDMVDKGMSYNTGRSVGAIYQAPLDVSRFAESMGALAYRCTNVKEIQDAAQAALTSDRATVLEIMVDPLEIPPILSRLLTLES